MAGGAADADAAERTPRSPSVTPVCRLSLPPTPVQVVKMDCSAQAQCPYSHLMHHSCYEQYEEAVLKVMRKTGRARSWSEQQRK